MNDSELRAGVLAALQAVAPGADLAGLRENRPLLLQLPLDQAGWLAFLAELSERFKVRIPQTERNQLVTLRDIDACLKARIARKAAHAAGAAISPQPAAAARP